MTLCPGNCQHQEVQPGHCHWCHTEILSLSIWQWLLDKLLKCNYAFCLMMNFPDELFILVRQSSDPCQLRNVKSWNGMQDGLRVPKCTCSLTVVDTRHLHNHANLQPTISSNSSSYGNSIYFTILHQHKLTLMRLSHHQTKVLFEVAQQPRGAPYEYSSSQK